MTAEQIESEAKRSGAIVSVADKIVGNARLLTAAAALDETLAGPALLPCPFCGSTEMLRWVGADDGAGWGYVRCDYCDAEGPDPENLPGHWNRRAARPSQDMAGDETVAQAVEFVRFVARWSKSFRTSDRDDTIWDTDQWRELCNRTEAALAAMDTPKGGGG